MPILALVTLAACGRGSATTAGQAPALASYAVQRMVLAPTARVRAPDTVALVRERGGSRALARSLDSAIVTQLRERDLARNWILPAELQRAFERNRTYASDPYQLAVEPIRSDDFEAGKKFGEPLSSQLRTMIALHEDARHVIVPVELRLGGEQPALRVAVIDPRTAEARWVGTVEGEPGAVTARSLTQLAERLVNLFFAP